MVFEWVVFSGVYNQMIGSRIVRLDEMDEGTDIQNYLYQKTGQRTVPNIFVGLWTSSPSLISISYTSCIFIGQQHIGGV